MKKTLLKALTCSSHAESFCKGNIILRSISYYRGKKGPDGDSEEIRIKTSDGSFSVSNPLVILCFHDSSITSSQYGDIFVKIKDRDALFQAIKEKISKILSGFEPKIRRVVYYDYGSGSTDDVLKMPPEETIFHKRKKDDKFDFEQDKEWRMAFFTKWPKVFKSHEDIEFKYFRRALFKGQFCDKEGGCGYCFREGKCYYENGECSNKKAKELTKDEYLKTKSDNYGDDLYYEIHLKNVHFENEILDILEGR